MSAKYTPGPWEVVGDYDTLIRGPGLRNVGQADVVGRIQLPEAQANAQLIAAAPDMAKALIKAREYIRRECADPKCLACKRVMEDLALVDAALKKAGLR